MKNDPNNKIFVNYTKQALKKTVIVQQHILSESLFLTLLLIAGVQSVTVSKLTDEVSQNSTYHNLNEISANNVDVFRQLLNQETLIRINLVKNVHALMKDMLTLQEKLPNIELYINNKLKLKNE